MANLTAAGYALNLDLFTDATNGINKLSVYTDLTEITAQTVNFSAASGTDTSGTVVMSDASLVFNVEAGHVVEAIGLKNGTTLLATYVFPTPYSFTNAGTFTLTDLTITLA